MKNYKIIAYTEISEENYENGEIKYVNAYDEDYTVEGYDSKEALKEIVEEYLCFSMNNVYYYGSEAHMDILVDADDNEVSINSELYELYKNNKCNLYNKHIVFRAYELNNVSFED